MSEKFSKVQSIQNGDFTAVQNRVDFIIPEAMGIISLRDSFVELQMTPQVTDADPASGAGIYPLNMKWTLDSTAANPVFLHNNFPNVALVRNAYISGERVGQIENVRRTDILRSNLYAYRKTPTGQRSDSYLNVNQSADPLNNHKTGIFTQLNKLGNKKSIYNDETNYIIRLADILDFCGVEALDLSKTGDLRIHLELNLKNVGVEAINMGAFTNANGLSCQDLAGGAGGAQPTSVQTKPKYPDLAASTYFVGQKLRLVGTNAGAGADLDHTAVIQSIAKQADGSLILEFGEQLVDIPANETVTAILTEFVAPNQPTVDFTLAQVVVKQMAMSPKEVPSVYNYYTFQTEETNGNAVANYSNGFDISGAASEVLIMPISGNGLVATGNDISSYRLRINNMDLTDRDVSIGSALYNDRLATTLDAIGYDLRNLFENCGTNVAGTPYHDIYSVAGFDTQILASPLPQTAQRKLLQINAQSAGMGAFNIYTKVPRVLEV